MTAVTGEASGLRGEGAQSRVEWPRENPPRPLPARPATFPPYEIRKLSNGLQVVLVSQNEQPSISVRMIVRAGAAHDPKGKHGLAMLTATLLDQGAGKPHRRADRRDDRLHRRRARHRRRHRPDLHQRRRDERQLRGRARSGRRRRAAADVRARRDRAAARAGAVGAEGLGRRPGVGRRAGDRSPDLRVPSLRHARQRHGGIAGLADARGLRGLPQAALRAEQRPDRGGRRHQRRRCDGRAREALRRLEAGRGARRPR